MRTLEKLSSVIEALIKAFQNVRNFSDAGSQFVGPRCIKLCCFRLQAKTFPTEIDANVIHWKPQTRKPSPTRSPTLRKA